MQPAHQAHLFICINGAGVPGKCGSKDSEKLFLKAKEIGRTKNWGDSVRINKSGCLGQCENGIACVIYPKGEWHLHQDSEAAPRLIEAVENILNRS